MVSEVKMSESPYNSIFNIAVPSAPKFKAPSSTNPAAWMYERLGKYIQEFEAELDNDHEVGARLVTFGQVTTFHIESMGYHGPDMITFYGISDTLGRVQLIQHISQLSVLLVAMEKRQEKPRRIGFLWDKETSASNPE
ncbi:hypothetical protein KSF_095810 [Reticulibacter mediterranei]|uniref:Uncharacterized protein n=1 Tax=Reticulibacter mediterranei TaxID=2778369 RepID=A0A8J3N8C0_9CHLR|nr:DUF6173 family protein [Reticulibacter mediterranei]GHO99533.1 hypothetical protein KSF_095810 [Reticulibacter mediterranei]